MLRALTGFAVIGSVVAVGYLVARLKVLPAGSAPVLQRLAYFVAAPALLLTVVARAELHVLFSGLLVVAAVSAVGAGAVFATVARGRWQLDRGARSVGTACAGYTNANNIGLPVATYVVGGPQYVAPVLLLQLLVLAPALITVLDAARGRRPAGPWAAVRAAAARPVRNPILLGALVGVVLALTGTALPGPVAAPLDVLGGAAVPLMLLGFGMSLDDRPPLAPGSPRAAVLTAVACKTLVMPALAYLTARFVLDLGDTAVTASTVMAALPTAQNMNTYAVTFDAGVLLARDAVLVSTIASVPVIVCLAALLR